MILKVVLLLVVLCLVKVIGQEDPFVIFYFDIGCPINRALAVNATVCSSLAIEIMTAQGTFHGNSFRTLSVVREFMDLILYSSILCSGSHSSIQFDTDACYDYVTVINGNIKFSSVKFSFVDRSNNDLHYLLINSA